MRAAVTAAVWECHCSHWQGHWCGFRVHLLETSYCALAALTTPILFCPCPFFSVTPNSKSSVDGFWLPNLHCKSPTLVVRGIGKSVVALLAPGVGGRLCLVHDYVVERGMAI